MINTDKNTDLLHADLTYRVRGAIFAVYNELGFGHKEQVYQKALALEFNNTNIPFKREIGLKVLYKNEIVGNYRPDFIVDQKLIIELKAVGFVPKTFETQLLQYLRATVYELGLLVNFGSPKLYIKRFINQRKSSIPALNLIRENHSRPLGEERR